MMMKDPAARAAVEATAQRNISVLTTKEGGVEPLKTKEKMAMPSKHAATLSHVASKSTVQLFRDCLRVVQHMAAQSPKGMAVRALVRTEFRRNANVADEQKIVELKMNAARALSNYLLYESGSKEPKIRARMAKSTKELIEQAKANAQRDTERRQKAERGEGAELEHIPVRVV